MDTILFTSERRFSNIAGGTVYLFITALFVAMQSMPLMANDLIAKVPNPILDSGQVQIQIFNEASLQSKSKYFDENVQKKYPKAVIVNVDKGIKHIKLTKYYDGKPVRINVVEINQELAKDYTLIPALASDTLANRRSISSIAKASNSIVALNGTFFKPQTGVPLGTLMINGKLYTGPIYDRVAFGIFDNGYDISRVRLNAKFKSFSQEIQVDNINQPRMLSTYVLAYTPDWGIQTPPSPKYGLQVVVKNNVISSISQSVQQIPDDGYVIVGPSDKLGGFKVGDSVKFNISTNPEWKNVKHIISGGPYLVKDGDVFIDITAENLNAIGGKNPRSAIGYTADNNLILVAVDGREGSSVGMTLSQLAYFMKSIGCVGAINLDGGGSTVMYVNGKVVNNPQQAGGIPLSNAIVFSKKG